MREEKLVVIGPVAPPVSGPGIKNRAIIDALTQAGILTSEVNTISWRSKPIATLLRLINATRRSRHIVLSVSKNGRLFLLFLVAALRLVFPARVALLPAGGSYGRELRRLPGPLWFVVRQLLRQCVAVYPQTRALAVELHRLGIDNVTVLPNCRVDSGLRWAWNESIEKRILFVSRITQSKGVDTAVLAVRALRAKGLRVSLDIYGVVDPGYHEEFTALLANERFVRYCGHVEPTEVQALMSGYDALLFPSRYPGEGLPGVLIEAAIVGIPTVTSVFPGSEELFVDNISAVLINAKEVSEASAALDKVLTNKRLALSLSREARIVGTRYSSDNVAAELLADLRNRQFFN